MKIIQGYPNFYEALMFVIGDKYPSCVSNDRKKFAYQIPLRNFRRGFDFYELNLAKDGNVFFTIATMVGFKTVCETNSNIHNYDLSISQWQKEIFNISLFHFNKDEYVVMKRGSIKKQDVERERQRREELKRKVEEIRINNLPENERIRERLKNYKESSDEFLKLSLELSQNNNKGCFVSILLGLVILVSFLANG